MSEKSYLVGGRDGWINVKREPEGSIVALCGYTCVDVESTRDGRNFFKPTEGVERGKSFSVKSGNLRTGNPGYRPSADLRFVMSEQILAWPWGSCKAFTLPVNPIDLGTHPIQLPDFPHPLGEAYIGVSQYAKNWFYLGHGHAIRGNNDRYLHPGSVSGGCVTVDPHGWNALYDYLILCRRGDGATVGTITVVR